MVTGERPFQGATAVDMISSILRDTPPSVTDLRADVPPHLARVLRRCLEKEPRDRYQTSRDVYNELRELRAETSSRPSRRRRRGPQSDGTRVRRPPGRVRADEGFWVAVLPFKARGADADVQALAEGLTEEIVTGLSRFSYLRVIARGSTAPFSDEGVDVRAVGRELGARYVLEGSLRRRAERSGSRSSSSTRSPARISGRRPTIERIRRSRASSCRTTWCAGSSPRSPTRTASCRTA